MVRPFQLAGPLLILGALLAALWTPHVVEDPLPASRVQSLDEILSPPLSVQTVLARSCNDCHSNHTRWPWYAHLRPIASKIREDVVHARRVLNFSEWVHGGSRRDVNLQVKTLQTSCSAMQAGMMPPNYYLYLHPNAKLANIDVRAFCDWARQVSDTLTNNANKP